ncbi:hypothetical protein [Amycolatopsis vastitatis]|uniref:hypothetical protein n=1 Tax=Amycolatopsis vastitatis TaxID=1905142 RepID=UPI0013041CBC|nr:hypothetical protein [Amycolatopsis vastitatis]
MTRTTLIAFFAFAIACCVAVTVYAVVDHTVYEIALAVVLIALTAYAITRVVRSRGK